MHYPYLAFCVDREGNLVITHQRDPTRKRPLEMEIPLAELAERGLDGAANSIGLLALSLLSMWYPEQFAEHPILKPESESP